MTEKRKQETKKMIKCFDLIQQAEQRLFNIDLSIKRQKLKEDGNIFCSIEKMEMKKRKMNSIKNRLEIYFDNKINTIAQWK